MKNSNPKSLVSVFKITAEGLGKCSYQEYIEFLKRDNEYKKNQLKGGGGLLLLHENRLKRQNRRGILFAFFWMFIVLFFSFAVENL